MISLAPFFLWVRLGDPAKKGGHVSSTCPPFFVLSLSRNGEEGKRENQA